MFSHIYYGSLLYGHGRKDFLGILMNASFHHPAQPADQPLPQLWRLWAGICPASIIIKTKIPSPLAPDLLRVPKPDNQFYDLHKIQTRSGECCGLFRSPLIILYRGKYIVIIARLGWVLVPVTTILGTNNTMSVVML